jgi:phosphoribosyl-ATP pyrophosphohydrolase
VPDALQILRRLAATIGDRYRQRPPDSYTSLLFDGGVAAIGAKLREEADELATAATEAADLRHAQVVHEASDLVFHLLVMLRACDVPLDDVAAELARREGISGLEEKRSRGKPGA